VKKKNLQDRDLPLAHSRIRDEVCYKFGEEDQRAVRLPPFNPPPQPIMDSQVLTIVPIPFSLCHSATCS
jgi:hypothetical protein